MTKKWIYISGLAALLSCTDGAEVENPYLDGEGKTPIATAALLDATNAPRTRAANKDFANADRLLAYLRHVTWNGGVEDARTSVPADQAPRLVTFTKGGEACTDYAGADVTPIGTNKPLGLNGGHTRQATDLTPVLYWDDFSTVANDLRTEKHYLQSFYGYCFNGGEGADNTQGTAIGGNITQPLNPETGVLGWSVPYDQTAAEAVRQADLLWSAEQTPIRYAHGTQNAGGDHGALLIPYTHAMSQVSVTLTAEDGFEADALDNTWLELQGVNRTCRTTAPTYLVDAATTGSEKPGLVKMHKGTCTTTPEGKATCTYQALVAPLTLLSEGNDLLKIYDADGNDYVVKVTAAMLADDPGKWGEGLTDDDRMKSGYNYHLTVNIRKVAIEVSATLKDWATVEARGTGLIQFEPDVTKKDTLAGVLKQGGLDIYKSTVQTFAEKSTTLNWSAEQGEWVYTPTIYWAGQGDASYFRALSPAGSTTGMTQGTPAQGKDVLWGYACDAEADKDKVGTAEEVAISPRTGHVPLHFRHAMSKITINLATSALSDAVELDGASIDITHLYTSGTLRLLDGTIAPGGLVEKAMEGYCAANYVVAEKTVFDNYCVIPQTIGNEAMLSVTLADGTRYSLRLNTCLDETDNAITAWKQGLHYTYTITLTKGAIAFRALVKNWVPSAGSGNAELEWD